MPFICKKNLDHLLGKYYGSGQNYMQCATFVQTVCEHMPMTSGWRAGTLVKTARPGSIARGTAIATFVNGRYPTTKHGKHAALYLGQTAEGIQVIDQWVGQPAHTRTIRYGGSGRSNDGNFFYVIER